MAIGVIKNTTLVGLMPEVTEGTYVAPAAATDYIQALESLEISPSKELIEREILTPKIGQVTPRVGQKSVTATVPVEFKAQGVEGGDPQYGPLLESLLGQKRQITAQITTKAGNTASQLEIQDADIGNLTVGDIVTILEAGAFHNCAIKTKDSTPGAAFVTIAPAAAGAFSDNVVISKSTTYFPADTGHPSLSLSVYWGNEILEQVVGAKAASMSLESFSTGQVGAMNFSLSGTSFDRSNAASPFSSPTFDPALPPILLSACLFQGDTQLELSEFNLSIENEITPLESLCDPNGILSQRVSSRSITGSFNPYMDDTSLTQFNNFDQNSTYSLFISAQNPSTTAGEFELGSIVGIYLPNCLSTEAVIADADGVLVDQVSFTATIGDGTTDDVFIGFV